MPDENKLIKAISLELQDGEKADISLLSTEDVDDEGDIIRQDGIDWDEWKALGYPLCLQHNTSTLLGHGLWVKKSDKGTLAKIKYLDQAWDVAKELRGKSINARILNAEPAPPGSGAKRIITKCRVREVSSCVVPVNPKTVTLSISKGLQLSPEALEVLLTRVDGVKIVERMIKFRDLGIKIDVDRVIDRLRGKVRSD